MANGASRRSKLLTLATSRRSKLLTLATFRRSKLLTLDTLIHPRPLCTPPLSSLDGDDPRRAPFEFRRGSVQMSHGSGAPTPRRVTLCCTQLGSVASMREVEAGWELEAIHGEWEMKEGEDQLGK
ncbi:hypothetical protein FJT64_023527 [Amphibalanus amphitrite]|uniref:Uncharacterized protein n=1 Tax=Amphibalanus amphitrite TaxID=1232801 RepID=A0A6A4WFG0_AMPAM|nr:hypothetical protein FJT64_023527 [Amphibalanus amphitrite]